MDSGGGRTETRPTTAEEEALKRNTDCVYFLASPLTCKKGNECEYRHSEVARLNPRDCYYWMKSNCLNPKCAFRHPPLVPPSPGSGPALPPAPTVVPKQIPMAHSPAYNLNKQSRSEPCIFFFQKGLCLKGEWCPFSHEPPASGNPAPQQLAKASPSLPEQPQAFKKEPLGIKLCASQQNMLKVSADVAFGAPVSSAKPAVRAECAPSNGLSHAKNLLPHPLGNKLPRAQTAQASVRNSNAWSRAPNQQIHPSDEHLQDYVEPGEIVGEHSSGLDAHVAYNVKGCGYSRDGDDSGRKPAQGGRKLDSFGDYDLRTSDYKPVPVYERNQYSSSVDEFERNGRVRDYYDMKPHRSSSEKERALPLPERRVPPRHKSPDEVDRSDLRHRLKQRKMDGSRSAVSSESHEPYRRDDRSTEDKYRGHHSHRDQLQVPLESSISARLRGRISLPGTSSGPFFHLQSEKERDMPRLWGRLSPTRPISNQGRQYDTTRRLSEEPSLGASARNLGGRLSKREEVDSLNFSGPKSLAELKGAKLGESSQEQSTENNVMVGKTSTYQEPEDSPSFESPKPLSVLLKRKREEAPEANFSSGDENNQRTGGAEVCNSVPATADEVQPGYVEPNKKDSHTVSNFATNKVETVEEEEDCIPSRDDDLIYDGQSSAKEDMLETEEYMEACAMEDQELQNYDQRDGEYDYEATETGDLKTEYDSQGEEEDELDDEEDFARKAGLMFS